MGYWGGVFSISIWTLPAAVKPEMSNHLFEQNMKGILARASPSRSDRSCSVLRRSLGCRRSSGGTFRCGLFGWLKRPAFGIGFDPGFLDVAPFRNHHPVFMSAHLQGARRYLYTPKRGYVAVPYCSYVWSELLNLSIRRKAAAQRGPLGLIPRHFASQPHLLMSGQTHALHSRLAPAPLSGGPRVPF